MNSIINHLGGAVSTVNDMVDAFDSFMENGGVFVPIITIATNSYAQFRTPDYGFRYIGYWYCRSYRDLSYCYIKVLIDTVSSSITLLQTYELVNKGIGIINQIVPFYYSNSGMGINWEYNDGNYNTIETVGVHFKIS